MGSRTKPAADRRAELLDAAKAVFAAKGVGTTTISDVTTAAGVANGTFYLYFESKEQLVAAIRDGFLDDLLGEIAGEVARLPADDWWGRVDTLVELGIRRQLDLLDLHDVVFHDAAGPARETAGADASEHERAHARAVEFIRSLLAEGTAAGTFAVTDPPMTARLLFNVLDGAVCDTAHHAHTSAEPAKRPGREHDRERRRDREREVERLVAAARQLFRRALAPDSQSPVAN